MVSNAEVRTYVAISALSVIEDDLNEDGRWSAADFAELQDHAYQLIAAVRAGGTELARWTLEDDPAEGVKGWWRAL